MIILCYGLELEYSPKVCVRRLVFSLVLLGSGGICKKQEAFCSCVEWNENASTCSLFFLSPPNHEVSSFVQLYAFSTVCNSRSKEIEPTKRTEYVTGVCQEEPLCYKVDCLRSSVRVMKS